MGIKSIWDNSYYKNYTPMPKWAFEVNFCNLVDPGMVDKVNVLNKAVTNAVWGKKEAGSIVPIYYAGIMVNHPGRITTAGELSLTFNENSELTITDALEKIFALYTFDEKYFDESVPYKKEETWKGNNIEVIVHDMSWVGPKEIEGKSRLKKYIFHNCFATNLEEVEGQYDNDDIVQRTMRFSYDYMTTEVD
jgi:hypothetical protein